jgi:fructose-1,6-bisphosphatase/sedoheptulose 1,7-bisphosphatase-like protein
MDRNLALEAVRVTEAAAIASARLMGRGDNDGADRAAVEAMRRAFNDLAIDGEVVIGPDTGVDVLMGIGGAPEGVISAAALRCVGGDMQGRLRFRSEVERERARKMGLSDLDGVLSAEELAGGNVMVSATGVTHGQFLKGVRFTADGARSHSVVMRSKTGTIRYIETMHRFGRGPGEIA